MASHTPQIRIISYNPTTIESEGRLADICHHFRRSSDMIMLQGTGTKDYDGEGQPKSTKCGSFWVAVGLDDPLTGSKQITWNHDSLQL